MTKLSVTGPRKKCAVPSSVTPYFSEGSMGVQNTFKLSFSVPKNLNGYFVVLMMITQSVFL